MMEKEFNLEGPEADKQAGELIEKEYEDYNDKDRKFNRYEFFEYSARALENCDFLNSFYTQKYQKSQNLEDLYCAFMARYVNGLIRRLHNPIIDSNNLTPTQQNYIKKMHEKRRDYLMKNLILGPLQFVYQPYIQQTVKKIMNNYAYIKYAYIKYKSLPQKKNINYINEDIKKFLGIDMEGMKNDKIKVNYNNIIEHLVTGNYSLDTIEKMHKEIENVANKRYNGAYNTYRNIEDTTPCDNKLHIWGMEDKLRKNIDKQPNPKRKKILNEVLKDLKAGKSIDICWFGN